ncbi:MAG TPA: DHA2 family efflux MFS transporter permease subunit [Candidatus Acidoferrales bacterium]|nr:DHA2 family efflux MFS transporter permease subunit [Candidatus Acidoferrales bacterium]
MAATTQTTPFAAPRPEPWQPQFNPWLIAVVVAMAAFMEVLDTSIANVALPYIAGGLAASNDQSTWVLTSYLAANAIVLPISGWIAARFGRKRFFILCILLFTGSSVLCGSSPSLGVLILFRALQGAGGGGLQPMAQAILADAFPPQKRGLAFALYGITAVLAPTIGPVLGGWITYNYSWRWIFYINLPVGILAAFLVFRLVEDPPYLRQMRGAGVRLDYIGLGFLAIGIGALQVVLDKGQEDDWFGSRFILTLSVLAAVCLISLVVREWLHRNPIMDLRLFKNFNFAAANLMMFMLGVVYFSSLVLMPQLLQTLMGYTAELAGIVLSASGVVLLLAMPIVGVLSGKFAAKYLIAFGWIAIAGAMFYSTKRIDLDISFSVAMWLRVAQVVGLPFLFVPITLAMYVGLPAEKSNEAAGIINFMRNIGSSVGTSMMTTLLARRAQLHQTRFVDHLTNYDPVFRNQLSGLARQLVHSGTSVADAQIQAQGLLYRLLGAQSQTLAYLDAFMVLTLGAGIMFLLSFLVRKNDPSAGGEVAVG